MRYLGKKTFIESGRDFLFWNDLKEKRYCLWSSMYISNCLWETRRHSEGQMIKVFISWGLQNHKNIPTCFSLTGLHQGIYKNGRQTGHMATSSHTAIRYKAVSSIMDMHVKYLYIKNPPTTLGWIAVILCHNLISKENKKRKNPNNN